MLMYAISGRTKTAFANAGHIFEDPSSYSPDFNNIKIKWTHSKEIRKKEKMLHRADLYCLCILNYFIEDQL